MTEARELLAVARFTGSHSAPSGALNKSEARKASDSDAPINAIRYRVTSGGDGLSVLETPCDVWIHRPQAGLKNVLAPSSRGIGAGDLFPARVLGLRLVKGGALLDLASADGGTFADSLAGCWLCIPRSLLEADDGIYRFQLIGLDVREQGDGEPVGTIKDYFETGAHGILTIRMLNDNAEVLVPFIDEFTELRFSDGFVLIPTLRDFLTS